MVGLVASDDLVGSVGFVFEGYLVAYAGLVGFVLVFEGDLAAYAG